METLNPHNIIEGKARKILVQNSISDYHAFWKGLFDELSGKEADTFDAFIAGYYIGNNPSLRDKYVKLINAGRKHGT